ncbi:MAG TPA: Dabb family protein [Tepidisphaeraceae bacterium]|jgi:hypothetical protein|nr:Dabb family protein [Tepidisphaeraceae bacterium]
MFIHTVFFWLKPSAPAGEAQRIAASCRELLTKIPTVLRLDTGHPANTPRDVVDNSYHVALSISFATSADHDIYQSHPLHDDFINRHKEHWQRVQVYDFK